MTRFLNKMSSFETNFKYPIYELGKVVYCDDYPELNNNPAVLQLTLRF